MDSQALFKKKSKKNKEKHNRSKKKTAKLINVHNLYITHLMSKRQNENCVSCACGKGKVTTIKKK